MSMILLEPANKILYGSAEDQAADHLINGDSGKFAARRSFRRQATEIGTSQAFRDTFRIAGESSGTEL
jgi:hypothetical protein